MSEKDTGFLGTALAWISRGYKFLIMVFNVIHIAFVWLAKLLIVAMVLVIFANVILRYVFDSGLVWSEEVALLFSVWFSFLSMAIGVKQGLHIHISLFPEHRIHKNFNFVLNKLSDLVVIAVGVLMLKYGVILVQFTMKSVMPATNWPSGWMYGVVVPAAVMMIWDAFASLIGYDSNIQEVNRYLAGEASFKHAMGVDK